MTSVSSFLAQHLPSTGLAPRPSSPPSPKRAPPANSLSPPSLPSIKVPPDQILRLVPWSVVQDYALAYFPEDVLDLRPEYKPLAQEGKQPPPAWLLEWYDTITLSAPLYLEDDDKKDRAALRQYEAFQALVEAYSAMWPAKVAQKVRVEADELKERIWLRWERLLGLHRAIRGARMSWWRPPPANLQPPPVVRSPPPGSYRHISPFANNFYSPESSQELNIKNLDPLDKTVLARYTFPEPPSELFTSEDSRLASSPSSRLPSSPSTVRTVRTAATSPARSVTLDQDEKPPALVFERATTSTADEEATADERATVTALEYAGSASCAPFSSQDSVQTMRTGSRIPSEMTRRKGRRRVRNGSEDE